MEKHEIINRIRGIIAEWGSFTVAELEGHSSPVLSTVNKDHEVLMERFERLYVSTTEYVHGKAVNDDVVRYEDLTVDQLNDVLCLAEDYDALSWKVQESTNDYDY